MEETKAVGDIMICHFFFLIIGLLFILLPLACVLLTLFYLDDVMNLGVVINIEAIKHFDVPSITTAYHTLALIEEHSK